MTPEECVEAFYSSLNLGDAERVAALFAPDGYFEDAATGRPVKRDEIRAMVERLFALLPDLKFEHGAVLGSGPRFAVEWTLRGTNLGPFRPGLLPSGQRLELCGSDTFELGPNGISRLARYFDQKTFAERLGLQVIVEPFSQESATFGYSMHVSSGPSRVPGILAVTWILGRDEAERDAIRGHSRKIIREFQEEPGFIGIVTGFAGERGFTVTAWEDEAALERALSRHHAEAKHAFRTTGISPGVWTSVWKPLRTNRIWTRCPVCSTPNDVTDDHRRCKKCESELPPRPPIW
jgi:steroid delta-isomerase-like uncharacterized protein